MSKVNLTGIEKHLWIKHTAVNQTAFQDYPIFPFWWEILLNTYYEAESKLFV